MCKGQQTVYKRIESGLTGISTHIYMSQNSVFTSSSSFLVVWFFNNNFCIDYSWFCNIFFFLIEYVLLCYVLCYAFNYTTCVRSELTLAIIDSFQLWNWWSSWSKEITAVSYILSIWSVIIEICWFSDRI